MFLAACWHKGSSKHLPLNSGISGLQMKADPKGAHNPEHFNLSLCDASGIACGRKKAANKCFYPFQSGCKPFHESFPPLHHCTDPAQPLSNALHCPQTELSRIFQKH